MTVPVGLGSTSRYRAELLRRLLADFTQAAPGVDEAALPEEAPAARALRLAIAKAEAAARTHPQALVIGSDQVAERGGDVLGARRALAVESNIRRCEDRFSALCRPMVVPWAKKRRT